MQFEVRICLDAPHTGIPNNTALRQALEELAITVGERYFDICDRVAPLGAGTVIDEHGHNVGSWRMGVER